MTTPKPTFETVAEAYLALLQSRGIDWLFANAGTDFAPIIEALARAPLAGFETPQAVPVAHETVAVGMAHGYYLASGRPQAVMLHVDVGLANGLVGLMNAARANVPLLLTSGRTPYTEHGHKGSRDLPIHWGQEMHDQGALVREHTKWEHELTYGDQIEAVVDRALAIAMAPPRGPVYLSLPRETLAAPWNGAEISSEALQAEPTVPWPDPASIERIADLLAEADQPLLVSGVRSPDCGRALAALAERCALPVVEFWAGCQALSTEHPMHAGFDPGPVLSTADVVVVLDAPVPWVPGRHSLADGCVVVQIGSDPAFSALPMRSHPSAIALTSDVTAALEALDAALAKHQGSARHEWEKRRVQLTRRHSEQRTARREYARRAPLGSIRRDWASSVLDEALAGEALLFNELGCVPEVMHFPRVGSYCGISIAGGLGWGLPAAMGAQLFDRDRLVVATVGDGSYTFANPVACHHTAANLDLPLLTVVFDNQKWGAVAQATRALYPQGHAVAAPSVPLSSLEPSPRFDLIIEACGGHGELVVDPDRLPAALEKAIEVVRSEHRQALVTVRIT